tara:strand:+ start:13 stop:579 length:567 start_codon:yes stop_codon:yes gene_type:complete
MLFQSLHTYANNNVSRKHFGFLLNKQDRLRVRLSKFDNFKPLGKDECCKTINKWKLENMEDREYRQTIDVGMRQICDYNVFPLLIRIPNAEYIVINLVSDKNVNIINILDRSNNTNYIDNTILEYHVFLVQYNYNPNYYELKSQNMKHFFNIFFLNFLSDQENKIIYLKKNDYIRFLEEDTKKRGGDS